MATDVDLDIVAAMVRACPGVDDLDGGPSNARLATYLPGRKIDGLRLTDDVLTVQIRSIWDVPVTEVAAQIRHALVNRTNGRQLDIIVADLSPAPGYGPAPQPESAIELADAELADAEPASISPPVTLEVRDEPVVPVSEPVVVERTVSVRQKVVTDPAAVQLAAPVAIALPATELVHTGQVVTEREIEGDPVEWTTDKATSTVAHTDANSSERTIPTQAETPKPS
ncbi:MAG: hypothetical protein ABI137_08300 [Antricoccus sp.]